MLVYTLSLWKDRRNARVQNHLHSKSSIHTPSYSTLVGWIPRQRTYSLVFIPSVCSSTSIQHPSIHPYNRDVRKQRVTTQYNTKETQKYIKDFLGFYKNIERFSVMSFIYFLFYFVIPDDRRLLYCLLSVSVRETNFYFY